MESKKKHIRRIMPLLAVLLIGAWAFWVISYNHKLKERDLVPIENYEMKQFAELGKNYCYGNYYDGISICANDYIIMDTDSYLKEKGLAEEEFGTLTEKICIVDLTVTYKAADEQGNTEQDIDKAHMDVDMGAFYMYGQDYYAGQNRELFLVENPWADGTTGIRFHDGDSCNVKLVFNLDKRYYTKYSWEHLNELPRMLYLTARPVQRNIVLHE